MLRLTQETELIAPLTFSIILSDLEDQKRDIYIKLVESTRLKRAEVEKR
jgi:hypothetical protein